MKLRIKTYKELLWIALLLTTVLTVMSCSEDNENNDERDDVLQLLTFSSELHDVNITRGVHVPSGYVLYTNQHPEALDGSHVIGAYLVSNGSATLRRFSYEGDHWRSNAIVKEGETYYIYGYMPMSAISETSITPVLNDYSKGATLTLEGLKTFSDVDVCITVGVKGVENPLEDVEVLTGNFSYQGKGRDKNHVYMLFDHLFSALQFSIRIDAEYFQMREIRLKSMVLKTETTSDVDAHIKLQPGELPITSVTYTEKGSTKGQYILLDTECDLTTSYITMGEQCYLAGSARSDLILETVYDVYDKHNNLIRPNCTSVNKLDMLSSIKPGEKRNIKLTVKPTYLHVLSDFDLDNPELNNPDVVINP